MRAWRRLRGCCWGRRGGDEDGTKPTKCYCGFNFCQDGGSRNGDLDVKHCSFRSCRKHYAQLQDHTNSHPLAISPSRLSPLDYFPTMKFRAPVSRVDRLIDWPRDQSLLFQTRRRRRFPRVRFCHVGAKHKRSNFDTKCSVFVCLRYDVSNSGGTSHAQK
jgi:hypothetical protein